MSADAPKPLPTAPVRHRIRSRTHKDWVPTPYAKRVGAWLRDRREQLGLTQRDAAAAGGCSDAWLCQLEKATIDIWCTTIKSLPTICAAYQIKMKTLTKLLKLPED
jgi:hypothetical protein